MSTIPRQCQVNQLLINGVMFGCASLCESVPLI